MKIKIILCMLLNLSFGVVLAENTLNSGNEATQQQKKTTIIGRIVGVDGEAIIGASIEEKGSTNGTVTDLDGKYSLTLKNENATLVFSYIGYKREEVPVNGKTTLDIVLSEDIHKLNEVVVVGYGTVDKKELTSAITHISSKDFLNVSSIDPVMQIQGKVAGVNITNTASGDPNSGASIQVRGVSSRSAGLGPLVVIDGVPGGNLQNVNANDIQSIDVLKDGAASAIYGTRGSNGVILVTTKRGNKDGKVRTEYNGYVSFDKAYSDLDYLSADEFRKYKTSQGIGQDYGANTDWFKEITRTGFTQNHSLTVSGGTAKSNYRVTADARNATGVDIRSDRKDYGARASFDHTTGSGLFKFSGSLAPRVVKRNNARSKNADNKYNDYDIFKNALAANPTLPIKDASDPTGKTYTRFTEDGMYNPVEELKTVKDYDEEKLLDWNLSAKLNLLPLLAKEGYSSHSLSTTATIAQEFNDDQHFWFKPSYNTTAYRNESGATRGEASQNYDKNSAESLEWIVNYGFEKNKHYLTAMGGYSYQQFMKYGFAADNKDFTSDALTWDNLGDGQFAKKEGKNEMSSYRNSSKLIGFFGRLSYSYNDRYMMTASLRYEGSSKFGMNNKWGYFPAVSVGWRLSNEAFMKGIDWLDDLKLRADYGVTGNQDFDSYLSLPTYGGYGDTYYLGQYYKGWGANKNPNPNLRWEKAKNFNIGVDFSVLKKLTGSVNYFNKLQQDLLGDYTVSLPPYLWDKLFTNVGTMRNTGFELELNYQAVNTRDFKYNVGLIASNLNNKFLDFSNQEFKGQDYEDKCFMEAPGSPGPLQRIIKGKRIGDYYTWRYAGVDNAGNWLVYNKNNDVIPITNANDADKAVTGNGLPRYYLSLNNSFSYKNLDLTLYFRGAFGFDIFNVQDFYWGLQAVSPNRNVLESAYKKNGQITTGQNLITNYFIEKGDYLKLDVISLGYTWNLNSKYVEKVRLYGTVRNALTLTSFSGIDPAQYPTNGLTPGTFNGNKTFFPSTTQFLFGAQVSF